MAQLAEAAAHLVEALRRERTCTHAGAVGLGDAHHLAYGAGGHAQTGAHAGGDGIAAGDKGIGAEVDVKHHGLRALGQHLLVLAEALVDEVLAVDETETLQRGQALEPHLLVLAERHAVDAELLNIEAHGVGHHQVLTLQLAVALNEIRGHDVAHADARAGNLVGVGGTDALQRRTNLAVALGLLVGGVHHAVARQNEVGLLADEEVLHSVDTLLGQRLDLLTENARLDEHAVADEVDFLLVEDAAGNDVQHMLRAVEFKSMAGIGAALEAGHNVVARRQHVDNLAFAFVAPLEAQQYVYLCHIYFIFNS